MPPACNVQSRHFTSSYNRSPIWHTVPTRHRPPQPECPPRSEPQSQLSIVHCLAETCGIHWSCNNRQWQSVILSRAATIVTAICVLLRHIWPLSQPLHIDSPQATAISAIHLNGWCLYLLLLLWNFESPTLLFRYTSCNVLTVAEFRKLYRLQPHLSPSSPLLGTLLQQLIFNISHYVLILLLQLLLSLSILNTSLVRC